MRHGALICLLPDNPRSRILDLRKAPGNILAFPSLSEIETLSLCTGYGKCSVYSLSHPFYPVSEIRRTGLISAGTWGLVFVSSTFCSILRPRRLETCGRTSWSDEIVRINSPKDFDRNMVRNL